MAGWLGLAFMLGGCAAAAFWLSREERSPWQARAFMLGVCLLYLLWVSAATPGLAAGRIAGEREQGTWQALLLTALPPSQIVTAKLLASLRLAANSFGLWLPLVLMGAHAARFTLGRLALILTVLAAAPITTASVSLWLSGRFRRSRTATTLAYLFTGSCFWMALISSPAHYVRGENLWWYASPAWQVAVLCLAEPGSSPLVRPLLPEWSWFLLGCGTLTVLALRLLTRRIAMGDG
jgi:ABC-type Na+ efflux pump permease subunit